ncbi:MAG: hypothetical protein ACYC0X_12285 [Pirellulaceae bacterium]
MNQNHETTTKPHAPSDLREQFLEWLNSYEPDRLQEIDIRPVSALLDTLADCGDVLEAIEVTGMQACFSGWRPELGTTRYGYPVVPDMSGLTDGEVRQWGRAAIDCRAEMDIDAESGQVDVEWVRDAVCWSGEVMEAVVGRLGDHDDELRAYATDVYARADIEIAEIREELRVMS